MDKAGAGSPGDRERVGGDRAEVLGGSQGIGKGGFGAVRAQGELGRGWGPGGQLGWRVSGGGGQGTRSRGG